MAQKNYYIVTLNPNCQFNDCYRTNDFKTAAIKTKSYGSKVYLQFNLWGNPSIKFDLYANRIACVSYYANGVLVNSTANITPAAIASLAA